MAMQHRILSIESLRGIAALTVALFHFNVGSHLYIRFVANSWLMVDLFFVLSGFVIAMNYQHRLNSTANIIRFQYKRFLRLYPLHLLMLLVFLVIESAKYLAHATFGVSIHSQPFAINNFTSFLANLSLLQNWTLPHLTWNAPSWSVSSEFYTYLLFALLVLLVNASRLLVVLVSLAIVIAAGTVLFGLDMGTSNITGPARCLHAFFLGVIAYNGYDYFALRARFSTSLPAVSALILTVTAVIFFGSHSNNPAALSLPAIFTAMILVIVSTDNSTLINQVLHNSKLVYLGTISYGIYMLHTAVWWLYAIIIRFVLKFPSTVDDEGKLRVNLENAFLADLFVLVGLATIILSAHFSYQWIERRFNSKRQAISVI